MNHFATTKESIQRLESTFSRIKDLKHELSVHLSAVREQREKHPHSAPYIISEKNLNLLYDHFQILREDGERIDYNIFTDAMEKIEELLKKLHTPVQFRRTDILNDISEILSGLESTLKEKTVKS